MIAVNMAYYRQEDWERFLEMADDSNKMHSTWKGWHKAYQKAKKGLIEQGLIVNDFIVDLDELQEYCKIKGIKNDGAARSQFVTNR